MISLKISKNCVYLNGALLAVISILILLASQDIRFTTKMPLYSASSFSDTEEQWLKRGDSEDFQWTDSHIKLFKKNKLDKKEAFIHRSIKISRSGVNSADILANKFDSQTIGDYRLLRVVGEIDVTPAAEPILIDRRRRAGYMVWFYDSAGEVKKYITVKSFNAKSESQFTADRTVVVPDDVQSIALVFMLRDSDATYKIKSMSVSFVEESKIVHLITYFLWVCYCLILCFYIF